MQYFLKRNSKMNARFPVKQAIRKKKRIRKCRKSARSELSSARTNEPGSFIWIVLRLSVTSPVGNWWIKCTCTVLLRSPKKLYWIIAHDSQHLSDGNDVLSSQRHRETSKDTVKLRPEISFHRRHGDSWRRFTCKRGLTILAVLPAVARTPWKICRSLCRSQRWIIELVPILPGSRIIANSRRLPWNICSFCSS